MASNRIVVQIIDALDAAQIPYMLVGAFSVSAYGIARSTKDADFVVQIDSDSLRHFCTNLGDRFQLDPQMSFESVTGTPRYRLQATDDPFQVELFCVSDDPHDQLRFTRRQKVRVWDRDVYHPTPEDVVITKLRWGSSLKRAKDIEDLRNVIAVRSSSLDWSYIERWCDEHGTRKLLDEIRASLPSFD